MFDNLQCTGVAESSGLSSLAVGVHFLFLVENSVLRMIRLLAHFSHVKVKLELEEPISEIFCAKVKEPCSTQEFACIYDVALPK